MGFAKRAMERTYTRIAPAVCKECGTEEVWFDVEDGNGNTYKVCLSCAASHVGLCQICEEDVPGGGLLIPNKNGELVEACTSCEMHWMEMTS